MVCPRSRLGSLPVDLNDTAKDSRDDSIADLHGICVHCQYQCAPTTTGQQQCETSHYLSHWTKQEYRKPIDFDSFYHEKFDGGYEVAVRSLGGWQGEGWKKENQDNFFVLPIYSGEESEDLHFVLGVFDGHGENGHCVSRIAKDVLSQYFAKFSEYKGTHVFSNPSMNEYLMRYFFREVSNIIDSSEIDLSKSGATAVLCTVSPRWISAGWIGDSKCVVGLTVPPQNDSPPVRVVIPITYDHKPDPFKCPQEAERVVNSGGRIDRLTFDTNGRPTGPFRLFLKDKWTPGLAVSRAFGDHIGRNAGVIPDPDIQSLQLPRLSKETEGLGEEDPFHIRLQQKSWMDKHKHRQVVILATDGLWEWVSSEEAMQIAWHMSSARMAADVLAEKARKNWARIYRGRMCDDITIVVLFLPTK